MSPADSPAASVSTAFPGGGGDAERRGGGGGGGGGGGTARCKGERSALIEPGRVAAWLSLEPGRSGSGRLRALLGLWGFLLLPPELRELELLRGGRGSADLLALPPARELWEVELLTQIEARVSLESWRSGSGQIGALLGVRGFLALPPPGSELRERLGLGLLRGGGGSEGFLALPPELWEIELGGDGGAAIFRPQEHRGDSRSMLNC